MYGYRHTPVRRLVERLGLHAYDVPAPYTGVTVSPSRVRLPLKQHVGAPSRPTVAVGDRVETGALVAEIAEGALGARVHASIPGVVRSVDGEVCIAST